MWFIKTKRRRVFDAGGASLEGSALHGVVFDRSGRPQKRAGEARLPGSGRESRMVKNLKHFEKAWFPVS